MLSHRQAREAFHFLFLERLVRGTDPQSFVLKGGLNLRFFHGSPRYSEDMDIDVWSERVAVPTLRKNGYKIIQDPAFRRVLSTMGIVDLRVNDPTRAKHTEITQRFRLSLEMESGQKLPTKVEFSRRGIEDEPRLDRIDPEVARLYGRTSFHCSHYDGTTAARQKVRALAGRAAPQSRDLFDLYLLDSRGVLEPQVFADLPPGTSQAAGETVAAMTFEDYEGQVLEYLDDQDRAVYGTPDYFRDMQQRVFNLLTSEDPP